MPCLLYGVDEAWLRLLYYEKSGNNYKNNASHDFFFVSKEGRTSPSKELEESLLAIKDKRKVGQVKKIFPCAFPARFEYIKKRYPQFNKDYHCPEFKEWSEEIGAKEIYLVYASSYVSNPASMFGHSFLRFSRGGKTRSDSLLDYSLGFMAITDPNDNPLMYSIKGIIGSYIGHFDIKPFYMQVGLYQNAEDRDLWEYKLPLDKNDVSLIVKHMWEVSRNTGFPYYFFDENCSYFVLKMIEAVKLDWNVTSSRKYIFAHPIETLKWAKQDKGVLDIQHFESINKVLRRRLSSMTKSERTLFVKARENIDDLSKTKSLRVLDALIDYWKFENYDKKTKLKKNELTLMNKTFTMRSQIKGESVVSKSRGEDPKDFHDPNKMELSLKYFSDNLHYKFSYQLGYQGLNDNPVGHDDYSYIDYFGFDIEYRKSLKLKKIKVVEINSHAPFVWELPKLSWRIDSLYDRDKLIFDKNSFLLEGGLGITFFSNRSFFYSFLNLENRFHSNGIYLIPKFSLGSKIVLDEFLIRPQYDLRLIDDEMYSSALLDLAYYFKSKNGLILTLENLEGRKSQFSTMIKYRIYQ
jgi:hypothetical protein